MTDPLDDAMLCSPANRQDAASLVRMMTDELPTTMTLCAMLTALGSLFVGLCDDHDIDQEAAMSQIADSLSRNPDMKHVSVATVSALGMH